MKYFLLARVLSIHITYAEVFVEEVTFDAWILKSAQSLYPISADSDLWLSTEPFVVGR